MLPLTDNDNLNVTYRGRNRIVPFFFPIRLSRVSSRQVSRTGKEWTQVLGVESQSHSKLFPLAWSAQRNQRRRIAYA